MSSPSLRDSGNSLLDRLPADEFDPLALLLRPASLGLKQIVHEFDVDVSHVYFPTTALVSLLIVLEDDDPVEATTVGREGFVGISASLGVGPSPHRALCQLAGDCFRLPLGSFLESLKRNPELARLVQRYIAFSLLATGQSIACNTFHAVEARACRWLLMLHDQAGCDEFPMTQEFLAYMLGVRRQSVTVVAGALQNAGLIGYRRGSILIRDRARLEEAACECYGSVRNYLDRVVV